MPVAIDGRMGGDPIRARGAAPPEPHLLIGLVNNMPASSRLATERQFRNLIAAASTGIPAKLSIYVSPRLTHPSDESERGVGGRFGLGELWDGQLDGLIVTGSEPIAETLPEEPNWNELAMLVDWAEDNTISTIWSCLAAHAAVYRIDGIPRRRLSKKLFGLFECANVAGDRIASGLMSGLPDRFRVPHSRWNTISEETWERQGLGYHPLTRSEHAGVDIFVKKRRSLFIFCQGHPEYDPDSLLLEYRRDVARFLRSEREDYPDLPSAYFDTETEVVLNTFKERALRTCEESLMRDFPCARHATAANNCWQSAAVRIYRNWLIYLNEQKTENSRKHAAGFVAETAMLNCEPWKNLV